MEQSKQLTYTLQEVRAIKKKAKDDGYKKGWNACKQYDAQMEQFDHKELQKIKNDYAVLQAKCERYHSLLQVVHQKAKDGIFPHLPIETLGAQKCIEIDAMLNEALPAGEGDNFTEAEAEFMKECNIHLLTDGGAIIQTENDEGARLTKDDLLRLSSILYRYANQKEDKQ